MSTILMEMLTELVTAQVENRGMNRDEMHHQLHRLVETLHQTSPQDTPAPWDQPKLAALRRHPTRSIQARQVWCLECGQGYQLLTYRHLARHEMTSRMYKQKWGFPLGQALSARDLTAKRRRQAQADGRDQVLVRWRAQRLESGRQTPSHPA